MPMHGKKKKGMARGGAKMKMRGGGMGMMGIQEVVLLGVDVDNQCRIS